MQLIIKRDWKACDGSDLSNRPIIPIGIHEVEKILNPLGYSGYWIVMKGTLIGASEGSWRQWEGNKWGDFEVEIKISIST